MPARKSAKALRAKAEKTMASKLPRERLRDIRTRAKMSASAVARSLEYASPAGYARFEQPMQGDRSIPYELIKKLIPLFRGLGDPPVTAEELIALSDAKDMPKPVAQAYVSLVDDGDGLLSVRYRVEAGVYIRSDSTKSYGASRIGVSKLYPASSQFVVVVTESIADEIEVGTQLHCVTPDQMPLSKRLGKRVVVGKMDGSLMEVTVGRKQAEDKLYDLGGMPLDGEVLGVVIGAYSPE